MPPAPFAYVVLMYRRNMHVGLNEVRGMALSDLYSDLEMLELEAEHGPQSAKPPTPGEPKMP